MVVDVGDEHVLPRVDRQVAEVLELAGPGADGAHTETSAPDPVKRWMRSLP